MRVRERWELRVPAAACARACACAMRVGVLAAARAVRDVFERVGAAGVLCDGCVGAVTSTAPDRIAHAHARARTTASAHIRARTHARAHTCAHAQHIHSARKQTHNAGTHTQHRHTLTHADAPTGARAQHCLGWRARQGAPLCARERRRACTSALRRSWTCRCRQGRAAR